MEEDTNILSYSVSFGLIIGSVIFAITGNAIWLALGLIIGATIGTILNTTSEDGEE